MDSRTRATFPGASCFCLVAKAGLNHGGEVLVSALLWAQAQLAWGIAHTSAPSELQPVLQVLSEIWEISEVRDMGAKPRSHPASTGEAPFLQAGTVWLALAM